MPLISCIPGSGQSRPVKGGATREFTASDITWIDELYEMAESVPPSDAVLITQLKLGTIRPEGGQIVLDGFAREPGQLQEIEKALRRTNREVRGDGGKEDPGRDPYRWQFKVTVTVPPEQPATRSAGNQTNAVDQQATDQPAGAASGAE
jgi:hypothetical protein